MDCRFLLENLYCFFPFLPRLREPRLSKLPIYQFRLLIAAATRRLRGSCFLSLALTQYHVHALRQDFPNFLRMISLSSGICILFFVLQIFWESQDWAHFRLNFVSKLFKICIFLFAGMFKVGSSDFIKFFSDAIAHAASLSFIMMTRLGKHTTLLYNSSSAIGCALLHFGNGLMVEKFLSKEIFDFVHAGIQVVYWPPSNGTWYVLAYCDPGSGSSSRVLHIRSYTAFWS